MFRRAALAFLALPVPFAATSCTADSSETKDVVALCPDCGVEKDAAGCCDPNAERCPDCKKIKGSAGCCK